MNEFRSTRSPRDEHDVRLPTPASRDASARRSGQLRTAAALLLACAAAAGCRSLSYEEPDAPPPPTAPRSAAATTAAAADENPWSAHANAGRDALRHGDLDKAEEEFLLCMAATEGFGDRDVRRLASLAIPAALAERHNLGGRYDDAARITDAVLAESQGGAVFPLHAWAFALQTRLEIERIQRGPEAELALARRIAEIHLGPIPEATPLEVSLRQQVGRLLAANGDLASAATQLGWAARAARPMLRLALGERLALLYEAADVSVAAGDPTTADFLLREAVELAQKSAPGTLEEVSALNQRGWFLVEQDRPEQALTLLEAARDIVAEEAMPAALTAATLDSLAVALHRSSRLDEASAVLDQALAAREAASAEDRARLSALDDHRAALDRDRSAAERNHPASTESNGNP